MASIDTTMEASVCDSAVEQQAATAEAEHPVLTELEAMHDELRGVMEASKRLDAKFKTLKKGLKKVLKKRRKQSLTPSNLMKPVTLSDELCAFLGQPAGTSMTRSQVTSVINGYATTCALKKEGNGRIIVLDDKLGALMGLPAGEEVPIFSIQTHLKNKGHYLSAPEAPVVA